VLRDEHSRQCVYHDQIKFGAGTKDRCRLSGVCRRWRSMLGNPEYWQVISCASFSCATKTSFSGGSSLSTQPDTQRMMTEQTVPVQSQGMLVLWLFVGSCRAFGASLTWHVQRAISSTSHHDFQRGWHSSSIPLFQTKESLASSLMPLLADVLEIDLISSYSQGKHRLCASQQDLCKGDAALEVPRAQRSFKPPLPESCRRLMKFFHILM